MGWNSWNKFGCNVSDKLIRETPKLLDTFRDCHYTAGFILVDLDDDPCLASVVGLFERQVGLAPDAVALVVDDGPVTYAELDARANQVARYLAGCGCRVTAVDRDPDALASLAGNPAVEVMVLDLEGGWWPFAGRQFDAIVVVRYLHRPLLPALLDSLASDGLLIYETFMRGNEVYGRPSNPDFLLAPDELLDWARPRLRILAFEQGRSDGERPAVVQRICALGHEAPEGKLD